MAWVVWMRLAVELVAMWALVVAGVFVTGLVVADRVVARQMTTKIDLVYEFASSWRVVENPVDLQKLEVGSRPQWFKSKWLQKVVHKSN